VTSQAEHLITAAKPVLDVAAVGVTVGAVMQWLPAAAAAFTLIWTGIRIYETDTIQKLFRRKPPQGADKP
jgi:hypothetical protein